MFISQLLILAASIGPVEVSESQTYPESRRGDTVDTFHGVDVPDPYR